MPSFIHYATAALAAVAPLAAAQTYTGCNPLDKTCPSDAGTTQSQLSFDFTQPSGLDQWTTIAGNVPTGPNGAEFIINQQGDAPTIETDFYMFFGEISITMQAAQGQGIVSSLVFESDDLDEIDWEALGGNYNHIETNYFGKGDTSTYNRATWPAVAPPAQDTFHTYTVNWQKDAITWAIDGNVIRTLNYADAQGGSRYPQTPMRVRIGVWAGGDPNNAPGTIAWAGGPTDYQQAPFTMYVKSVQITNANPADSYTYTDNSGSWQSIQMSGAASKPQPQPQPQPQVLSQSSSSETDTTTAPTTAASTESSTAATTLATTTQSSSASPTTASSSSGAATTGSSSSSGLTSSSASGSASGTPSGSPSSSPSGSASGASSSSPSGSMTSSFSAPSSSTSASPSASPTLNAATNVAANYLGPLSFLALVTAFIQM